MKLILVIVREFGRSVVKNQDVLFYLIKNAFKYTHIHTYIYEYICVYIIYVCVFLKGLFPRA